jgi:hypothetical protein
MKDKKTFVIMIAGALIVSGIFAGIKTIAQEPDKAEIQQEFRKRLTGCEGIAVYVNVIAQDASEQQSMKEKVEGDVEQVLKDGGIKVLSEADIQYKQGRPRLRVHLVTFKEPQQRDVYIYSFRIFHLEDAILDRTDRYTEGLCWDSGIYVGRERLSAIRSTLKSHVLRYVNDYLAVNPKKTETRP